jgi:hypothetical protein
MMQDCPVCGQAYGLTHTCPRAAAVANPPADEWPVPKGFAPLFYIRQAIAIARFEDAAIVGASRDSAAIFYGIVFWLMARILVYANRFALPKVRPFMAGYEVNWAGIAIGIAVFATIDTVYFLVQYGLSHVLARLLFRARGTCLGILRSMFLGSFVSITLIIPYVGMLIAALWMIAILMRVFEEVDGIERIKAFWLSFVVSAAFQILALALIARRR